MLHPEEEIQEEMVTTLFTLSEVEELERKEQKQLEQINSGFATLNLAKEKEIITAVVKNYTELK